MIEAGFRRIHMWLPPARALRAALDGLIAVLIVATVLTILVRDPVYTVGLKLLRYQREILFACIVARLLVAVPWKTIYVVGRGEKIMLIAAAATCFLFLREAILFSGWNLSTERALLDQMAFGGSTQEEIRAGIYQDHLLYPDPLFLSRVMDQIPERQESRILYLGDQRPFMWAAQLYPRELYAPPRLQKLLIDAVQGSWQWTGIIDPLHRVDSQVILPPDPNLPPLVPEWQEELTALIKEKQIGWVVYYDSAWPERRFIHRIDIQSTVPAEP